VVTVFGGIGWLYLLRSVPVLAIGPQVDGALPLQQLAGDDAQPLLRVALAWVPAGAVAGAALRRLTALHELPRIAALSAVALVVLVVAGAISDAAAISASVQSHVLPQLGRVGTWAAVGLIVIGAQLQARWGRDRAAAPSGG
jgi:hypothetical protein